MKASLHTADITCYIDEVFIFIFFQINQIFKYTILATYSSCCGSKVPVFEAVKCCLML